MNRGEINQQERITIAPGLKVQKLTPTYQFFDMLIRKTVGVLGMFAKYRIYLVLVLSSFTVVYGIFFFPSFVPRDKLFYPSPTIRSGPSSYTAEQVKVQKMVKKERSYCLNLPDADSMDCQCYSQISGLVSAQDTPKVAGAEYADQTDLGRGQASKSCR